MNKYINQQALSKPENSLIGTITRREHIKTTSKLIEDVKLQINQLLSQLEHLRTLEDFEKSLPFKSGDVALHPNLGNVIVLSVHHDNPTANSRVTSYFVAGVERTMLVPIEELVPINQATMTLYRKSEPDEKG